MMIDMFIEVFGEKLNRLRKGKGLPLLCLVCLLACAGIGGGLWGTPAFAAQGYDQVASGADQSSAREVLRYGMIPIRGQDVEDGTYRIEVRSSSRFFRVEKAVLKADKGEMTAEVTLSSTSYKYFYPGTAEAAAAAPEKDYIAPRDREGQSSFRMEVPGLNQEISMAAFSKRKKAWYDRTLLFDAETLPAGALKISLPDYDRIEKALEAYEEDQEGDKGEGEEGASAGASGASGGASSGASGGAGGEPPLTSYDPVPVDLEDGEYSIQVNLSGGSGRAGVTSPTWLIVKGGKAWARLLWSSSHYDYMMVGGKKYPNETTDGGNSTFTIPIAAMDRDMPVIADTTAMGDPVEIEYKLTFYEDSIGSRRQIPQEAAIDVLVVALTIILLGGVLNFVIKKRRKQ